MFLTSSYGTPGPWGCFVNRHGEQTAAGLFLILFSNDKGEIRACVRHVRMVESGHWMVGSAQVGPERVFLSGSYGADGLTRRAPAAWDRLFPLPEALREAWNKGGGWNSAGSEAPAMHRWALDNLKALRVAGTKKAEVTL